MKYYRKMMGAMLDVPGPVFRLDAENGKAARWDAVTLQWIPIEYYWLDRKLKTGEVDIDEITLEEAGIPAHVDGGGVALTRP